MYSIDRIRPKRGHLAHVLTIDPGNVTGAALFHLGQLRRTWRINLGCDWMAHLLEITSCLTVIAELPKVRSPRDSKGDPNDLVGLILQCGELCGEYGSDNVHMVRPEYWKKQHTKSITRARCERALSANESEHVINDHNVWDAVGIGLWFLGRY